MLSGVEGLDAMLGEGGLACHPTDDGYVAIGTTRRPHRLLGDLQGIKRPVPGNSDWID
jgi:hypothetical protein